MSEEHKARVVTPLWIGFGAIVLVLLLGFTRPGRRATSDFIASLRIERPKRVTAAFTPPAGSRFSRRVQDMVARMVTGSVDLIKDEPDRAAKSVGEAADSAGFTPLLAPAGHGAPNVVILGARTLGLKVQRDQLATILREAGRSAALPVSLDGASIRMRTLRGIQVQYGDCPAQADTTLQGQFQRPPSNTPANRDCLLLSERPDVSATLPAGLDVDQLLAIALEVSGESPDEARRMRDTFDAKALLGLDLPRFVRSHDFVKVRGVRGVLMSQGWRRGPAYTLVWADQGRVYEMSGYSKPDGAVPLADSLTVAPAS